MPGMMLINTLIQSSSIGIILLVSFTSGRITGREISTKFTSTTRSRYMEESKLNCVVTWPHVDYYSSNKEECEESCSDNHGCNGFIFSSKNEEPVCEQIYDVIDCPGDCSILFRKRQLMQGSIDILCTLPGIGIATNEFDSSAFENVKANKREQENESKCKETCIDGTFSDICLGIRFTLGMECIHYAPQAISSSTPRKIPSSSLDTSSISSPSLRPSSISSPTLRPSSAPSGTPFSEPSNDSETKCTKENDECPWSCKLQKLMKANNLQKATVIQNYGKYEIEFKDGSSVQISKIKKSESKKKIRVIKIFSKKPVPAKSEELNLKQAKACQKLLKSKMPQDLL